MTLAAPARREAIALDAVPAAPRVDQVLGPAASGGWSLAGCDAPARRALSCLVEPEPGDAVLIADHAGQPYILAVLSRAGLGDATLSLPDPLGQITLRAQSLTLEAKASLTLAAPETTLKGASLQLVAGTLSWFGRACTLMGERVLTLARHSETVANTVTTKAANRVSIVDGTDSDQVGAKVTKVETVAAMTSQSAVSVARDDLRFDAKRISLG